MIHLNKAIKNSSHLIIGLGVVPGIDFKLEHLQEFAQLIDFLPIHQLHVLETSGHNVMVGEYFLGCAFESMDIGDRVLLEFVSEAGEDWGV